MSLRVFLSVTLASALLSLVVFAFVAARTIAVWLNVSRLPTISIAGVHMSAYQFLFGTTSIFVFLGVLVYVLLYLLFNRIVIKPIIRITDAMNQFVQSRAYLPLTDISLETTEIRNLAQLFADFTDSVERIHDRDTEISRVKSDFISTAAHQLRTPLTGIRWALEALQKESLTDTQQVMVKNAVDKSRDLVAIVGTLLDISSIESGKHKYLFTDVNLPALTESVVNDFTVLAGQNAVTLNLERPDSLPRAVRADREQVKWVLNNLIENAIRYTPSGGSVHISFVVTAERLQVLVRDTGIGIMPKDRNNIFERFYRAGNAIAKENKGNGLGLYIARTIATDHGGDLNFTENAEGPGTTFTLSLPYANPT